MVKLVWDAQVREAYTHTYWNGDDDDDEGGRMVMVMRMGKAIFEGDNDEEGIRNRIK